MKKIRAMKIRSLDLFSVRKVSGEGNFARIRAELVEASRSDPKIFFVVQLEKDSIFNKSPCPGEKKRKKIKRVRSTSDDARFIFYFRKKILRISNSYLSRLVALALLRICNSARERETKRS